MGKRIISQNRGKGTPTYKAPSHKYKTDAKLLKFGDESVEVRIEDVVHDPARNGPVFLVRFPDGRKDYVLAVEGKGTGDVIKAGDNVEIDVGNITYL